MFNPESLEIKENVFKSREYKKRKISESKRSSKKNRSIIKNFEDMDLVKKRLLFNSPGKKTKDAGLDFLLDDFPCDFFKCRGGEESKENNSVS